TSLVGLTVRRTNGYFQGRFHDLFDQYRSTEKAGFFSLLSAKISPFRVIRVLSLASPTVC
ncbi:MAG TPA: hypothetical protein PL105_10855, partial [Caldilineaceae bacterium]|nr:hypothetical protein [Caldilineaceae bacterium]